jgi:cobalamin biosynthesis protein CobD/CbiB
MRQRILARLWSEHAKDRIAGAIVTLVALIASVGALSLLVAWLALLSFGLRVLWEAV